MCAKKKKKTTTCNTYSNIIYLKVEKSEERNVPRTDCGSSLTFYMLLLV